MIYLIVGFFSYLLGSFSSAYFLSKMQGVDLKKGGSGNLGASNATVLLGWKVGVCVALIDISKGFVPVVAARMLFPDTANIGAVAGICAAMGHIFPFYLKFRGGKGFATYVGMTFALDWKMALCVIVLALVITLVTNYIALGTLTTVVVVPAWLLYQTPSLLLALVFGTAAVVIIYKHWDNLVRIRKGTEIGLRSTIKGENRIK